MLKIHLGKSIPHTKESKQRISIDTYANRIYILRTKNWYEF